MMSGSVGSAHTCTMHTFPGYLGHPKRPDTELGTHVSMPNTQGPTRRRHPQASMGQREHRQ